MGGEFFAAVRERVRQARVALEAAVGSGDVYEVALAQDELGDALSVAGEHGIETGPCAEGAGGADHNR
ncbi:hypothetical protein [Streptomyces sp. NPDC056244]|uniref:hypothetical protein n=1 Tax=Streptomyces sp. NPDC056244 TaxID=3345762 RepID=UPI0035DA4E1F